MKPNIAIGSPWFFADALSPPAPRINLKNKPPPRPIRILRWKIPSLRWWSGRAEVRHEEFRITPPPGGPLSQGMAADITRSEQQHYRLPSARGHAAHLRLWH